MTELNTNAPGNFNAAHAGAVKLERPEGLKVGLEVFFILNLATHWEVRGPVKIDAFHEDGVRVQLRGHPHGWFDPKHIFHSRSTAAVAADQLTQAIRRSTYHGRTG